MVKTELENLIDATEENERGNGDTKKLPHVVWKLPEGSPLVISESMEDLRSSYGYSGTPYYCSKRSDTLFCVIDRTTETCTFYEKDKFQSGVIIPLSGWHLRIRYEEIVAFFDNHSKAHTSPRARRRETAGTSRNMGHAHTYRILKILKGPLEEDFGPEMALEGNY